MPAETLFSPTTLLWLAGSATAVAILFGSINRRRTRLTESLRASVDRQLQTGKSMQSGSRAHSDTSTRSGAGTHSDRDLPNNN